MGKCYSKVNRGQRKESDFYQTPYSMTEQLLENEYFHKSWTILDPASGDNAIIKVLIEKGYSVNGNDIKNGYNFLEYGMKYEYIITNPPFSLANEFIEKCYQVCNIKFALLLPLNYLQGKKRYDSKTFRHLKKIYVFTRMPMLSDKIRENGTYKTGMQSYAWYIFEQNYNGDPIIKWIDNNKFCTNKE